MCIEIKSDSDSASDDDWVGFTPRRSILSEDTGAQRSLLSTVKALFGIKVYRYLVAAMAALYFVVTGVQYWGTSYMLVVLGAPRPLVTTVFVICAASAPTSGVFFGGWSIDSVGGYKGAKQRVTALELCVLYGEMYPKSHNISMLI